MKLFFKEALEVPTGGLEGSARDTGRAAGTAASVKLLQVLYYI